MVKQNTTKRKSPNKTRLKPETWVQDKMLDLEVQKQWAHILGKAVLIQNQLRSIEQHLQWLNAQIRGVGRFKISTTKGTVISTILHWEPQIRQLLENKEVDRMRKVKKHDPKEAA